ncbi:ornithine cyclodeaminase family protein [Haloferax mediterranei ATCC 33500]|uniref:Ornithine cyclodeaminase n=1 Tax=Haloferax mediterranei (strain ATCC 33500 / DSM 1411 / JCM 8866 / NBRC 14739 / NCIMB 2177 / R-4) TaxID=523841 RepID=I3R8I3_HALMT|nr:ornithine cyclodeaminase family protein [Haloferax mediterranei]AFK20543.2 ornithine cyclodeaminase [Haloferax mediterranei ATCC 33500]AHZ23900.1 ornithine cyclodeaminase [Haloferax mediterranei ATCC 33500]ELZ98325.1 ornithine cyclodeaminase [Haloferax mediterranei ATCC 33500]MDX5986702.1 ornithine cyclodeaminase family protein [Haloferax mediterranei ATCC 33500]QCQ76029.1 ornithine cyclodeaminase family protein [Haloferax mediterranei ATCC 33500]
MTDTLFLTSDEVSGLATPAEYVEAVREGYRQRGEGAPAEPRTKLFNREPPGMLTTYSSVLPETGAMGGYMYSAGFGAEDAWFMTPLFDAESGEPLALLDGASMNPFKTGAAGGVAVDALAREDASTVALIGSGAQARGQLRAIAAVRDLETVWVYSPTKESREQFAGEMDRVLDASVAAVASSAAAVEGADIVVTATTASDPVFDGDLLEPGTHVTAMGQYHPDKRELDATTIERATYVPDLRERATMDAGSFLAAMDAGVVDEDHIHAELGEVVAGVASGREDDEEITVFDSGGTGIETVASAYMLYEKAREEGLGTTIDFAPASEALTGE